MIIKPFHSHLANAFSEPTIAEYSPSRTEKYLYSLGPIGARIAETFSSGEMAFPIKTIIADVFTVLSIRSIGAFYLTPTKTHHINWSLWIWSLDTHIYKSHCHKIT